MGFGLLRGLAGVLLLLVVGGVGYAIGAHNGPMMGPDGAAQMHYYGHWDGGFHIFGFIFFFFIVMMLLRVVFSPWRHRRWGGPWGYGGGYWGGPMMHGGGYWGGGPGMGGPGMGGPAAGNMPAEMQSHLDEMHRQSHERMDASTKSGSSEPPASAQ